MVKAGGERDDTGHVFYGDMKADKLFGAKHPSRNLKKDAGKFGNKFASNDDTFLKFRTEILWEERIMMPLVYEYDKNIFAKFEEDFKIESKRIGEKYREQQAVVQTTNEE